MNKSYEEVLIMEVVEFSAVDGAEDFVPPPKTGNLKDPTKIAEKVEQCKAEFLANAGQDPLLGNPVRIAFTVYSVASSTRITGLSDIAGFLSQVRELFPGNVDAILGPHPTTHMRLVQNAILRDPSLDSEGVFAELLSPAFVERKNIWHDVCPAGRGDFITCIKSLGLLSESITAQVQCGVRATLSLAKTLGYVKKYPEMVVSLESDLVADISNKKFE